MRVAAEGTRVREEGERWRREREALERDREKLETFGRELQQRSQEIEDMCQVTVGGHGYVCVGGCVAAVVACRYHCSLVVEQRLRPVGPE